MEQISTLKIVVCVTSVLLSALYNWCEGKHRTATELLASTVTSAVAVFMALLLTAALSVAKEWTYVFIFGAALSGKIFIKTVCNGIEGYVKKAYTPEKPNKEREKNG